MFRKSIYLLHSILFYNSPPTKIGVSRHNTLYAAHVGIRSSVPDQEPPPFLPSRSIHSPGSVTRDVGYPLVPRTEALFGNIVTSSPTGARAFTGITGPHVSSKLSCSFYHGSMSS